MDRRCYTRNSKANWEITKWEYAAFKKEDNSDSCFGILVKLEILFIKNKIALIHWKEI